MFVTQPLEELEINEAFPLIRKNITNKFLFILMSIFFSSKFVSLLSYLHQAFYSEVKKI